MLDGPFRAKKRQSAMQQTAASALIASSSPRSPRSGVVDTEHEFRSFWNQSDPNDVEEVHDFISSQQ
jgi:hypothetical protein